MELKSTLYGKIMVNANKTKTVIKKNPKTSSFVCFLSNLISIIVIAHNTFDFLS